MYLIRAGEEILSARARAAATARGRSVWYHALESLPAGGGVPRAPSGGGQPRTSRAAAARGMPTEGDRGHMASLFGSLSALRRSRSPAASPAPRSRAVALRGAGVVPPPAAERPLAAAAALLLALAAAALPPCAGRFRLRGRPPRPAGRAVPRPALLATAAASAAASWLVFGAGPHIDDEVA